MATIPERRRFLEQSLKYFLRQTYRDAELIVVGESPDALPASAAEVSRIRYIEAHAGANLGAKLNLGIEVARGSIVQKLDDDDYYHPEFLATMVSALSESRSDRSMAAIDCCPVLMCPTGDLKWTGHGRFAGGTLCFARHSWQQRPFPDIPKDVDRWFVEDHQPDRIRVCRPGLYVYVRHGGTHLWTQRESGDVDEYFARQPDFWKPLDDLMDPEDVSFYRSLQGDRQDDPSAAQPLSMPL